MDATRRVATSNFVPAGTEKRSRTINYFSEAEFLDWFVCPINLTIMCVCRRRESRLFMIFNLFLVLNGKQARFVVRGHDKLSVTAYEDVSEERNLHGTQGRVERHLLRCEPSGAPDKEAHVREIIS